uniref:Integrase catalytic domain-containing protein n=1 Tax=Triticum urartu TaxID=4572 RepID=A0A8R7RFU0_TRIUA
MLISPLKHPFTALHVAKAYMDYVFKLHGSPDALVSDHDRIFTSKIWKELCRLSHTTLNISSARHPQTDGTSERVNQCMEIYLRRFVHNCPKRWKERLSLAEFWYNTSYHSTLKTTPFEVLYGHLWKSRLSAFSLSSVEVTAVGLLAPSELRRPSVAVGLGNDEVPVLLVEASTGGSDRFGFGENRCPFAIVPSERCPVISIFSSRNSSIASSFNLASATTVSKSWGRCNITATLMSLCKPSKSWVVKNKGSQEL